MMTTSDNIHILYQWPKDDRPNKYLDIDWPAVHKEVGADCINWIQKQGENNCCLHLELFDKGSRLIVEFFNQKTRSTFYMMWS